VADEPREEGIDFFITGEDALGFLQFQGEAALAAEPGVGGVHVVATRTLDWLQR